MTAKRTLPLLGILAVLGALAGCRREARPNVLLVTFDTTRADHMGYASGRRELTPMLDAMAARGTWFANAITVAPLTLVAHTSIMTGLNPPHSGVRDNGTYVVPPGDVTLAQRLHDAGYATHAIVSAFVLDKQFGLNRGFDAYDDDLAGGPQRVQFMFKEIKANITARKAVQWLERDRPRDRPFFLWLHFFDPHANYDPPPDVARQFPGDPYSGEIHYADRELGRVIASLDESKLLDRTLFVFTADHGESLGEHGETTHGIFVYESTTHVPMLLAGPGVPRGKRVAAVVRAVDISPTILALLHLPPARQSDGKSLQPVWQGREKDERIAYVEALTPLLNFGWGALRGLRSASWKRIDAPRPELYDLRRDPLEEHDLAATRSGDNVETRELAAALARARAGDPFEHGAQQPGAVAQETRQALAALGYLAGPPPGSASRPDRPDAKDRIGFWNRFETAQDLVRQGGFADAAERLGILLREDPGNVMAMGSYAHCLSQLGRKDEALALFRRMIALDSGRETSYLGAAHLLQDAGRFDEARALIQHVLAMRPQSPDGSTAMGDLLLAQQRFGEAERWFRRATAIDPHSMLAVSGLGNCLNREGKTDEAARVLRAAYDRDPTDEAVAYNLGVVAERSGELKAALALYRHVLDLDPRHSMAWNNLGSLLDRAGRRDEALVAIQQAHAVDPNNAEATYNLGALLVRARRLDEALPLLDEAVRRRPDLLPAQAKRAEVLAQLGRPDEALAAWRAVATREPAAWLNVARLLAARGDRGAAKAALQRAMAAVGPAARATAAADPALRALL